MLALYAKFIYSIAAFLGLPVTYSNTNVLLLRDWAYVIAPECIGYRSLISVFLVCLIYCITNLKVRNSIKVLSLSIIMAIMGNISRILLILYTHAKCGADIARFTHNLSGYVIYLLVILLLFGYGDMLKRRK